LYDVHIFTILDMLLNPRIGSHLSNLTLLDVVSFFHKFLCLFRGPRRHSAYGAVLQIGRSLVRSQLVSLEFFMDIKSFRSVWGARWPSWLRHCSTSRKVAGSIPDGVIGIFHWHNSSGRTMALGLTQTLTEMSTRNISWGCKGGRCGGLDNLTTFICRLCWNQGASASWNPQGLSRPLMGLLCFYVLFTSNKHNTVTNFDASQNVSISVRVLWLFVFWFALRFTARKFVVSLLR